MITAFEFLKNRVKKLSEEFKGVKFRYSFNKFTEDHIIEVPEDFYSNEDFEIVESNLILEFIEMYPYESVFFITDSNNIKVEQEALVFYCPVSFTSWGKIIHNEPDISFDIEESITKVESETVYNYQLAA